MAFLKIGANEKIQIVKLGEVTEVKINSKENLTIETEDKKEELKKAEDKQNEDKKIEEVK